MFKSVAHLGALLFAVLTMAFFVVPDVITTAWGMQLEGDAAFVGQRLAAAFAGFAVCLFLVKDLPPSPARRAVAFGAAACLFLLALVGVLALSRGEVAGGILLAVTVEVVIGTALLVGGRATA